MHKYEILRTAAVRPTRLPRFGEAGTEPGAQARIGVVAAVLLLGLGGCGTLANGTMDEVYAVSDPAGAKASVSLSEATCITPCKFEVSRATPLTIFFSKPGYDPDQIEVKTRSTAAEASVSHEITADYLGRVADYQDGSHFVHEPNPASVKLNKTAPPEQ